MATKKSKKKDPEESLDASETKVGYGVAISKDGDILFQVFGTDQDLIGVLGLHRYAELQINKLLQQKTLTGDALVHEVGKAVQILLKKSE